MSTSKRRTTGPKRASAKRASTKRTSSKQVATRERAAKEKAGDFVCPECGRTFARAAALGAHRSRAHGVAGKSARATSRRNGGSLSAGTTGGTGADARASRRSRRGAGASRDGVDRDALLRSVFPNGIPAREDAMRAVTAWLDDAERLVRMR